MDALNGSKGMIIMLKKISISDKCCFSELSIHQRNLKKFYSAVFYIIIIIIIIIINNTCICLHEVAILALLVTILLTRFRTIFLGFLSICTSATAVAELCSPRGEVPWNIIYQFHIKYQEARPTLSSWTCFPALLRSYL